MGKSNTRTKNQRPKVQCIEVLIPRNFVVNTSHNLHWTLSVYSLENHPVKKSPAIHNSVIFHFMVYDWKRTIKELLETHQVPYSIIQYFTPETIYSDTAEESISPAAERELISALESLDATRDAASARPAIFVDVNPEEKAHLTLEEEAD